MSIELTLLSVAAVVSSICLIVLAADVRRIRRIAEELLGLAARNSKRESPLHFLIHKATERAWNAARSYSTRLQPCG